jgi:hypothetical protein
MSAPVTVTNQPPEVVPVYWLSGPRGEHEAAVDPQVGRSGLFGYLSLSLTT